MGKNRQQRQVMAVRTLVNQAMSDLVESKNIATAIEKLKSADGKLRELEVGIAVDQPKALPALLAMANVPSPANMWLYSEFTEHDVEAEKINSEIHIVQGERGRSRSIYQQSAAVHSSPAVAAVLENCGSIDFDAIEFSETEAKEQQICIFGAYVTQYKGNLISTLKQKGWINNDDTDFSQVFLAYLRKLDTLYNPVHYHNSAHAVDVMAMTDLFMRTQYITERTTSLDHFMALTAAAVHDVGHPGKNQLFLVKTTHELSIRYNDKSVLENMHCQIAFSAMLEDPACNWQRLLSTDDQNHGNIQHYVRKGIIFMVLNTDMRKHQKHLDKFAKLAAESEDEPEQLTFENKLILLGTLVHAADLSNPAKPKDISLKWTQRVSREFWDQGDQERALKLPISPMCDKTEGMANLASQQLGFINFVCVPLYKPIAKLIVEVRQLEEQLKTNAKFWEEKQTEGASYEQIFGVDV